MSINIAGIPKNELLAAFHNATTSRGLGMLHDRGPITAEQAQAYIDKVNHPEASGMLEHMARVQYKRPLYFDYVLGRPLKLDLSGDELDPRSFDRDTYPGASAEIVKTLRERFSLPAA